MCMKIRLQAGFEPSTLCVQKKSFLHSIHFTTAAFPLSIANSSYYNVNPINCSIYVRCPRFLSIQTNCLQTSVWD